MKRLLSEGCLFFIIVVSIFFIPNFISADQLPLNPLLKGVGRNASGDRVLPAQHYKNSKISSRLAKRLETLNKMKTGGLHSKNAGTTQSEMIRVVGELGKGLSLDRLFVEQCGGKIIYAKGRYFGLEISGSDFNTLVDKIPASRYFRLPYTFEANEIGGAGVSSTGALIHHSDGVSGQGVDIAVIDVGFKGLTDAISSNDIPGTVIRKDFTAGGLETGYKHGTQCAEILHEMAPDAQLHLLKISDDVEIAQAFDYCVENNVDIISLSIGTFGSGPGDGTGFLHGMCAYAEENGVLVVASAGNYSVETLEDYSIGRHWEGAFKDDDNDGKHDFSYNTNYNVLISVPDRNDDGISLTNELKVLLRWNDWIEAVIDYDLHLYDFYTGEHIASSSVVQNGSGLPVEMITVDIPDTVESRVVIVEVTRKDGHPVGTQIELYLGANSYFVPYAYHTDADATAASSLGEPADSLNVLTVGAINNEQWTTGPQQEFSSQGPTNAWAGSSARTKPDIMGPDGVLTQVGGENLFWGTSAAAPHVAGAAALMKSKYPELGGVDLKSFLSDNAVDMGETYKDNIYGWGRLNIENLQLYFSNLIPLDTSTCLSKLMRDDFRDRIYVGDADNKRLIIIDSQTERVVNEIACDSEFKDMAVSKDGSTMAIAGGSLAIVDLETFHINYYEPCPDIISVAFDYRGKVLFFRDRYHALKLFDPQTETASDFQFIDCSGFGLTLTVNDGLVRTGPEGRMVYLISGITMERYDIAGDTLTCSAKAIHGDLDDIYDVVVANDGERIYTQENIIDAVTLELLSSLPSDISPLNKGRSVCLDRGSRDLYVGALPNIGHITLDPVKMQRMELKRDQIGRFIRPGGIDTDRQGEKVFYILGGTVDSQQQVWVLKILKPFTVVMPSILGENAGVLKAQGMVRLMEVVDQDLVVYLESDSQRVQVPEQILISAGQKTAVFDILIHDNTLVEPLELVQIKASAQGLDTVYTTVDLKDDEILSVRLDLPDTVSEGQTQTVTGKVILDHAAGSDLLVSLESGDTSEIQVPAVINVLSGRSEAEFSLDIQDDNLFDGPQTLSITANVAGYDAAPLNLTVLDNENKQISITCPDELTEGQIYDSVAEISIPGIAVNDLVIDLSSSNTCRAILPLTAAISAGESTTFFEIDLTGDTYRNPVISTTIEAAAPGWHSGLKQVDIIDDWKVTDPFQINLYTSDDQYNPAVSGLENGGFVVVWISEDQDGGKDGIFAQIYDKNNDRVGTEFQINTTTNWNPSHPSVAGLSDGGFAVVWEKHSSDMLIQFFDEHGVELSEEMAVEDNPYYNSKPDLVQFPDGKVAIIWKSGYSGDQLKARFVDPEKLVFSQELSLYPGISSFVSSTKIAPTSSDGLMVVSSGYVSDKGKEISARLFDLSGNPSGSPFTVNTLSDGDQTAPSAVTLADGSIVAIWLSTHDNKREICCRYFTSLGQPTGPEMIVASYDKEPDSYLYIYATSIASLSEGGFLVSWYLSCENDKGVYGKLFDEQNRPWEIRLKCHQADSQLFHKPEFQLPAWLITTGSTPGTWSRPLMTGAWLGCG